MRLPPPVMCAAIIAPCWIVAGSPVPNVLARDNGQWENSPPHVRQWFRDLKQPDNPRQSCCGEADAYEDDLFFEVDNDHYVAIITNVGCHSERDKNSRAQSQAEMGQRIPPVTAFFSLASGDRCTATSSPAECDRTRVDAGSWRAHLHRQIACAVRPDTGHSDQR
jgi:hypothetical protein